MFCDLLPHHYIRCSVEATSESNLHPNLICVPLAWSVSKLCIVSWQDAKTLHFPYEYNSICHLFSH